MTKNKDLEILNSTTTGNMADVVDKLMKEARFREHFNPDKIRDLLKEIDRLKEKRDEAREKIRLMSLADRGWIAFDDELPEPDLSILVWMPQYLFAAHVVMGDDGQLEIVDHRNISWPLKDYKKYHCTHWRTILPPEKDSGIKRADEARELVLDMFVQACRVSSSTEKHGAEYDHMCLGVYELAQEELIKWGMISEKECLRAELVCRCGACKNFTPAKDGYSGNCNLEINVNIDDNPSPCCRDTICPNPDRHEVSNDKK